MYYFTDLQGVEGVSGDGEEAVEHGGAGQQRRHPARARARRSEGPQQLLQRKRGAGQAGQDEQPHLGRGKYNVTGKIFNCQKKYLMTEKIFND